MKYIGMLAVVFLLVAGGYYWGKMKTPVTEMPTPTLQPTSGQAPPVTAAPTVAPIVDETAAVIAVVKAAEVARVGADANLSQYTVTQLSGNYAKGTAGGSGGGAQWFSAKVNGVWKLAFIGNGTISCAVVNPYNFPNTMIPECWDDATQKSVVR